MAAAINVLMKLAATSPLSSAETHMVPNGRNGMEPVTSATWYSYVLGPGITGVHEILVNMHTWHLHYQPNSRECNHA